MRARAVVVHVVLTWRHVVLTWKHVVLTWRLSSAPRCTGVARNRGSASLSVGGQALAGWGRPFASTKVLQKQ